MSEPEIHPVQVHRSGKRDGGKVSSLVTLRAYEVYCEVFSPQPALVDLAGRGCRGGFSAGELIAFLYARSFPKAEWSQRFNDAIKGMEI